MRRSTVDSSPAGWPTIFSAVSATPDQRRTPPPPPPPIPSSLRNLSPMPLSAFRALSGRFSRDTIPLPRMAPSADGMSPKTFLAMEVPLWVDRPLSRPLIMLMPMPWKTVLGLWMPKKCFTADTIGLTIVRFTHEPMPLTALDTPDFTPDIRLRPGLRSQLRAERKTLVARLITLRRVQPPIERAIEVTPFLKPSTNRRPAGGSHDL